MLRESAAGMQASVVQNGHSYAVSRISAQTSLPGYISELTSGISSYATTQQLLEQAQSDSDVDGWPALCLRLESMREALLSNSAGTLINLTADADELAEVRDRHLPGFMDTIGSRASQHQSAQSDWGRGARLDEARSEGFSVPTQVNYVGLGGCCLTVTLSF
jgi:Zn-dependent M16 (insulinase) family peptidase